jgi:hypothetical protein
MKNVFHTKFVSYLDFFFLGIIDTWYDIPSHSYENSHGEVHLILEYQPQKH